MKKLLVSTAVALGAFGVSAAPTLAQDSEPPARQFSAATGEKVAAAQEQMKANQWGAAISTLQGALNSGETLVPYERSIIHQMMGQAYYEQNNFGQAISNFESAISAGGLLPNESASLRVNIAQLLIGDGQYARGAQMLENYLANGGQRKPQYDEYIMQAWVQSENYSRALPYAERWFNAASPKERKHFDLLNFLYNNLGMQGKQADIVRQMIARFPEDKQLWQQWISMLSNGGREKDAFEATKMLYLTGAFNDEADLTKVVQYYGFYDMPYQAAEILQKEMNSGRIARTPDRMVQLSDLYRQAREYDKAVPVLEAAAQQSGSGKLYASLGEAYFKSEQCEKAEAAFKQAISRGYDAGKSWTQIANCRYTQAQDIKRPECPSVNLAAGETFPENFYKGSQWYTARQNAVEGFRQVPASSKDARAARQWINFVQSEEDNLVKRCKFEVEVERDLCFIKIEQAYDSSVFTGGFDLQDEKCLAYKDAFDAKYRRAVDTTTGQ